MRVSRDSSVRGVAAPADPARGHAGNANPPPISSALDCRSDPPSTLRRRKPCGCVSFLTMEQLRRVYAAFNARDLDAALALLHPDVDWPNGWEGGRLRGRDAVRAYWTRQWQAIDSHVDPVDFTEAGDRVAVTVHQVVRDLEGNIASEGRVSHVYTLRDGLVARMDIVSLT